MAAGPARPSASVLEQPPGLKSLSVNSERGEFRRGHGRGRSRIFLSLENPNARLGWDKGGGTEGPGGRGTIPGLPAAPQGQAGDKTNIYPGKGAPGHSHPKGFTAELGELQQDPALEAFPGQQHQGLFQPKSSPVLAPGPKSSPVAAPGTKSSPVPAPGRCLGSSGVSFYGNKILEEKHSIQVICWILQHLKWDFSSCPGPAPPGQGSPGQRQRCRRRCCSRSSAQGCHLLFTALGGDRGLTQPKPKHPNPLRSSRMPSAVDSSGRSPNPTTQTR